MNLEQKTTKLSNNENSFKKILRFGLGAFIGAGIVFFSQRGCENSINQSKSQLKKPAQTQKPVQSIQKQEKVKPSKEKLEEKVKPEVKKNPLSELTSEELRNYNAFKQKSIKNIPRKNNLEIIFPEYNWTEIIRRRYEEVKNWNNLSEEDLLKIYEQERKLREKHEINLNPKSLTGPFFYFAGIHGKTQDNEDFEYPALVARIKYKGKRYFRPEKEFTLYPPTPEKDFNKQLIEFLKNDNIDYNAVIPDLEMTHGEEWKLKEFLWNLNDPKKDIEEFAHDPKIQSQFSWEFKNFKEDKRWYLRQYLKPKNVWGCWGGSHVRSVAQDSSFTDIYCDSNGDTYLERHYTSKGKLQHVKDYRKKTIKTYYPDGRHVYAISKFEISRPDSARFFDKQGNQTHFIDFTE